MTCDAIGPGPFATGMNHQLLNDPVAYQQFISQNALGRRAELDDMAGEAVFLASDGLVFHDRSVFVDGGWTAR